MSAVLSSLVPEADDADVARVALEHVHAALESARPGGPHDPVRLTVPEAPEEIVVPRSVHALLSQVLAHMANGQGVTLVPAHAELTRAGRLADALHARRRREAQEGRGRARRTHARPRTRLMPFVVLYDANVLYPSTLRDVLLRVAIHGLVQAKRTEEILDETFRNLSPNRPDLDQQALAKTCRLMKESIRDVVVTGYERLVDVLVLPDPSIGATRWDQLVADLGLPGLRHTALTWMADSSLRLSTIRVSSSSCARVQPHGSRQRVGIAVKIFGARIPRQIDLGAPGVETAARGCHLETPLHRAGLIT